MAVKIGEVQSEMTADVKKTEDLSLLHKPLLTDDFEW